MTTKELSNEFDLRWDNLRYNDSGYSSLNEYEKSLYLTQAQEILFTQMYQKFDIDEQAKRILSPLVKSKLETSLSYTDSSKDLTLGKFKSISVTIPEDLAYILSEQLKSTDGRYIMVKPIKVDQYNIIKNNPFRSPNNKRAWRTEFNFDYAESDDMLNIPGANNKGSSLEIITSYEIANLEGYYYRYLMYPTPIILEEITDDSYKIRGYTEVTEAILNNVIHEQIVDTAIQLASAALYQSASKQ